MKEQGQGARGKSVAYTGDEPASPPLTRERLAAAFKAMCERPKDPRAEVEAEARRLYFNATGQAAPAALVEHLATAAFELYKFVLASGGQGHPVTAVRDIMSIATMGRRVEGGE